MSQIQTRVNEPNQEPLAANGQLALVRAVIQLYSAVEMTIYSSSNEHSRPLGTFSCHADCLILCWCVPHSLRVGVVGPQVQGHGADHAQLRGHLLHPPQRSLFLRIGELHHQAGRGALRWKQEHSSVSGSSAQTHTHRRTTTGAPPSEQVLGFHGLNFVLFVHFGAR